MAKERWGNHDTLRVPEMTRGRAVTFGLCDPNVATASAQASAVWVSNERSGFRFGSVRLEKISIRVGCITPGVQVDARSKDDGSGGGGGGGGGSSARSVVVIVLDVAAPA
jgi:hypothetical protein